MWDGWEADHACMRREAAELQGYCRAFNKASTRNWGTKAFPGPTLNLRKAPGKSCLGIAFQFPIRNADQVYLCAESGDWYGVVYTKTHQNCNVSTPWQKSLPYTGPCRSGWVHRRWIELIAG